MATADLSHYNLAELKGLLYDIEIELKARERNAINTARERVLAIAREQKIRLEELLAHDASGANTKAAGASPPYRNPENAAQTWSGRGRRPKWVSDALSAGVKLADLAQ